jgi:leader peptidase (prepilin peptidase)/N-methyltransferase
MRRWWSSRWQARVPLERTGAVSGAAIALALVGAVWGVAADRIAARWPVHEAELEPDGTVIRPAGWRRPPDWRTVVVAVVASVAFYAVGLRFEDMPELAILVAWVFVLVLMLATDIDQRLLPDVLTVPLIAAAVLLALVGQGPFVAAADLPLAAAVSVAVPVGLYALSLPFGEGAFGLGDVKFLIGFGLFAGVERFVAGLIVGVLVAGVVIVVLLVARRITLHSFVPYGPFLVIGALWSILGPR